MSSSFVGKMTVGGLQREIQSEVNSTIDSFSSVFGVGGGQQQQQQGGIGSGGSGRRMMGVVGGGGGRGGGGGSDVSSVDWTKYNYPPGIRLIHYDPKELPTPVARIAQCLHFFFISAVFALCFNFINVVVLSSFGFPAINVVYSLLNFLILVPISGLTFYRGYKAIATSRTDQAKVYFLLQSLMLAVTLLFALAPLGAINGLARFSTMETLLTKFEMPASMKGFWIYATIIESVFWLASFGLGAFGIISVWTFDPFHSQQTRSRGFSGVM